MRKQQARVAGLAVASLTLMAALLAGCPSGTIGGSLLSGLGGDSDVTGSFNLAPTALATASSTAGIVPLTVQFDSADSSDDGLIVSRLWDFGDGATSTEISPTHVYETTGQFAVRLTLVDDGNPPRSATTELIISVTQAPVARIRVTDPLTGEAVQTAESSPATFRFDGSESSDPDGEDIVSYAWDFGDGRTADEATVEHTFDQAGTYRVELAVTDEMGVRGKSAVNIQVGIADPTLRFGAPPATQRQIVVPQDAQLWVNIDFQVDPSASYFTRVGLARDLDQCTAQSVVYANPANSPELEYRLEGHEDLVNDVAFRAPQTEDAAEAELLSASDDQTLRLYDATNGDFVLDYSGHDAAINAVAWGPSGNTFAYALADGTVLLASTAGAILQRYAQHAGEVYDVAYAPTATTTEVLSVGADGRALVWNTAGFAWPASGQLWYELTPPTGGTAHAGLALTAAHGGAVMATGGEDGSVRLWQAGDGAFIASQLHITQAVEDAAADSGAAPTVETVRTVAFSPDASMLLTGGDNAYAIIWNVAPAEATPLQRSVELEHPDRVTSGVFFPNDPNFVATGCKDGSVRVWNLSAPDAPLQILTPCSSEISAVDVSADGSLLAASIRSGNDLQLDLAEAQGNDLNVRTPQPLVVADVDPGEYFLWAEVDTDKTEPIRTYARGGDATIITQVVAPLPTTIAGATVPEISMREYVSAGRTMREATVIAAPSTRRQIFDIGPLERGDLVKAEFIATPGYDPYVDEIELDNQILLGGGFFFWYASLLEDETFSSGIVDATLGSEIDGIYSMMLLDENQQVLRWYRSGADPLEREENLIVLEDSAHTYVVLDSASSARIIVDQPRNANELAVRVDLPPREQHVFLDFRASSTNLVVDPTDPFATVTLPEFDAATIRSGYSASDTLLFKQAIEQRLETLLEPYNIVITTSDDPTDEWPTGSHIKVLFGSAFLLSEETNECGDLYDYAPGLVEETNPRNPRTTPINATGIVGIEGLDARVNPREPDGNGVCPGSTALLPAQDMAAAISNATAHVVGELLGLDKTENTADDIMDPDALWDLAATNQLKFTTGTPANQLNSPGIGEQDAPSLLEQWYAAD